MNSLGYNWTKMIYNLEERSTANGFSRSDLSSGHCTPAKYHAGGRIPSTLSQPTLSKFLKGLEGELGLPLFERLGNKYIPTYAGEQYIKKPRKSWPSKKNSIRRWAIS